MINHRRVLILFVGLICLVLAPSVSSCRREQSLKIGFIGTLSGRHSDMGVAARNGMMFAAEELNAAGGIAGTPVEILCRDDRLDPQFAVIGFEELVDEGSAAIIGPLLSVVGEGLYPAIQEHGVLTISPTVSSNYFCNKDDDFIRVYPASKNVGVNLADYVHQRLGLKRVSVIYDTRNLAFAMCAFEDFRDQFVNHGGSIVASHGFRSGQDVDFMHLARMIQVATNDGVYIIAGAMDSAMICQQLRKLGYDGRIVLNDWAATDDLIEFGGKAVESIVLLHTVNEMCELPRYKEFAVRYHRRFDRLPSYAAIHAYDAANVLFTSLKADTDPSQLKSTILKISQFEGVQTTIKFNEYGDVERRLFPMTIIDGRFKRLGD